MYIASRGSGALSLSDPHTGMPPGVPCAQAHSECHLTAITDLVPWAPMRVLIACEYSARVRRAFRRLGHDAWSVDILPTMGNPRWHIQGDALEAAYRYEWDMVIGFPPCTYLSTVNARRWKELRRCGLQQHAAWFFKALYACPAPYVAIENPTGWMNTNWRKPDQIIQPYMFGDPWRKRTCLWLKNLPLLEPTVVVDPTGYWVDGGTFKLSARGGTGAMEGAHAGASKEERQRRRNRTFRGVATAMAEQWG